MKLIKIIHLAIFFTVFVLQGCRKEWLEEKVDKKQVIPKTVADFQAMLDDYGALNKFPPLNDYAIDGFYLTDNGFNAIPANDIHLRNAYARTDIEPYIYATRLSSLYSLPYSRILNMNIILDQVEKSTDQDKIGLSSVKAQALFHRARFYFNLSQSFIPPYNSATAKSDLGLALRLSTDLTAPSARSTVQQTYDQIISDLESAKDALPNEPFFLTRPSKPAVLGLLAKVYLSMGNYQTAFNYADEYLQNKSDLLDYTTLSKSANFIGVNKEVVFLEFANVISNFLVEQSFFDIYSIDDLRKEIFFQSSSAGITFKGTYGNARADVFTGIATDEMYLIRAEGYARAGDTASAMKDLNDLLRTRWEKNPDGSTKYVDQSATSVDDALDKILLERRKQLILRNTRWTDLRRLNREDRLKVILTRTINGQMYSLEPDSYKYTFPIPYEIIQKAGLPQNEGW